MTDLDRTTAILSIRRIYIEQILSGEKTIEWRRKPLPNAIQRVLMWRTSEKGAMGSIVGAFDVEWQRTGAAPFMFRSVARSGCLPGISLEWLNEYADGNLVTAIKVADPRAFVQGNTIGLTRGPQAFQYAPADWRTRLEVAW